MRDMIDVARRIQDAVPRKYKGYMEGLVANLDYIAPEERVYRIADAISAFLPVKPEEPWEFEVISIWSTKTIDEIKSISKAIAGDCKKDLVFNDPVLHAWEGDKIVFSRGEAGSRADKARAKKFLVLGETYTVEKVEVHDWSTTVFLKEFPGTGFNSVFFIMIW